MGEYVVALFLKDLYWKVKVFFCLKYFLKVLLYCGRACLPAGRYVVALFLKSTYRKIGAFFVLRIWDYEHGL